MVAGAIRPFVSTVTQGVVAAAGSPRSGWLLFGTRRDGRIGQSLGRAGGVIAVLVGGTTV